MNALPLERGEATINAIPQFGFAPAALALLVACAMGPPHGDSSLRLTEKDAGRPLKLRTGDKLEVVLEGNPTTGFKWEVGGADASVVKLTGKPEFKPSSDAVGAAGRYTFHFEAVGMGQTRLKLIYRRPFEQDTPPARTFEVTLTVR